MFKTSIGNVHKLLMASENNTGNTEYAKICTVKVFNECFFHAFLHVD